jgi:hypothetical protein
MAISDNTIYGLAGSQVEDVANKILNKQDTLVSGTNIKTINNTSLLGSGDISIPGMPSNYVTTDTTQTITGAKTFENTSTSASNTAVTLKSDNMHKGTNPSSNHFSSIDFTDDSDAIISKFSAVQTSDGWTGFLAGAGNDPTNSQNNLLMIANGNNKLLLIPPTQNHASCAVRKDYFDTALGGKVDGFTMNFFGQWSGGPHAVKFCQVDYSTANSENGIFIKMSMVNSHGNGSAGKFLQDAILNVTYTGGVEATLYRYFSTQIVASSSPYHLVHDYGDVFWTIDTTNKIVKFYVLMHQFSRTFMSPYFRLNSSTGGTITQSNSGNSEEYSSGTQNWSTNYSYDDIRPTDSALSSTSTNPVQNKVVYSAIGNVEAVLQTLNSGSGV